jgi:hypothetical protein
MSSNLVALVFGVLQPQAPGLTLAVKLVGRKQANGQPRPKPEIAENSQPPAHDPEFSAKHLLVGLRTASTSFSLHPPDVPSDKFEMILRQLLCPSIPRMPIVSKEFPQLPHRPDLGAFLKFVTISMHTPDFFQSQHRPSA